MSRILIVEDERAIADIVAFNLNRENYETETALDGTKGLSMALEQDFDLILLDVMLPGLDGWEVLKALREKKTTPVIMLTAREEELDKIHGLELGADDYITKPFSMNELKARIKANLRRVEYAKTPPAQPAAGLTVDRSLMRVCKDGRVVELTAREYALLLFLYDHRGSVFSREQLLVKCWGYDYEGEDRAVDTHIKRLREKLGDHAGCIKTVIKSGYRLEG